MAVGAVSQRVFPPTNTYIGRTKLTDGVATISFPGVTDNTLVYSNGNDANVTGFIKIAITAGTGFTLTSSAGAGDEGFVAWMVVLNNQAS